jgi:hypothetical protein
MCLIARPSALRQPEVRLLSWDGEDGSAGALAPPALPADDDSGAGNSAESVEKNVHLVRASGGSGALQRWVAVSRKCGCTVMGSH